MLYYFAKTISLWAEATFLLLFTPLFEVFSKTQKIAATGQLVHDFLSQQNNRLFLFLSELMNLLWLAETSQQPISQTTWLKVTPHCNHFSCCLHLYLRFFSATQQIAATGQLVHFLSQQNTKLFSFIVTIDRAFFVYWWKSFTVLGIIKVAKQQQSLCGSSECHSIQPP